MKKMTAMVLGLSLMTASAIAGQAHMTADSSGREYSSMPQEVQASKKIRAVVGSEVIQIEMLADGKMNLLFVGEHKFKAEFKKGYILGQDNMLVAQTNRHTVIITFGAGFKQVGGLYGILDHMTDLGVAVKQIDKDASAVANENDNLAIVLMDKSSQILGVRSMTVSNN